MTVSDADRSTPETAGDDKNPAGFAALIRARTQTVHREAERSGIIADLLRGRATRQGYATFLASLVPAYEVMEAYLRGTILPALKPFAAPGLARLDALRADLDALARGGDAPLALPPEAASYAAAVARAAAGNGIALVGHAYARYLGDLSGGQILKPLLARTLGLDPARLGFYDFPDIPDIAACKAAMRIGLDTIAPDSTEAALVLDEAVAAFRHNIAVSSAVSRIMLPEETKPHPN